MNCTSATRHSHLHGFTNRLLVLLTAMLLLSLPGLLHAAVTASLDRNVIYTGDTATLHITTTGDDEGKQPDLSPLRKDFEVLGTSSSSQIRIINGQRSDKHEWLIELAPIAKGAVTIPALTVGKSKTEALTLQVSDVPAATTAQAGQPIFIRSEISPAQGDSYVQQQILYITRLYYRVPLIEGSFTEPKIDNAIVEQLGEDKQYNTAIDGQSYQVFERRYAIFPEQSGKLSINPTVFSGRTVSETGRRSGSGRADSLIEQMLSQNGFNDRFFSGTPFGDPGKRVRLASNALTLDIKPRPGSDQGTHWLPTSKLVLQDSWADAPPVIHAGEPVTRSLTLEAKGLEASQLPELKLQGTDNLRIYPEQPQQTNRTDGDWVYGRSEQRFAYVASQPGKLHFPAVTVSWWNTLKNKQQSTVLPAYDVTVLPGNGQTAAPTASTNAKTASTTAVSPTNSVDTPTTTSPVSTDTQRRYWQLAAGLIVVVLLAIVYLLLRRRHKHEPAQAQVVPGKEMLKPVVAPHSNNHAKLARARQTLREACSKSDPHAAASALLDWAAVTWPQQPPRGLGALATRVDQGAETIRELETVLYGNNDHNWNGLPLWKVFANGLLQSDISSATRDGNGAPPLYPDWHKQAG